MIILDLFSIPFGWNKIDIDDKLAVYLKIHVSFINKKLE
jgi:hypothetical protein